MQIPTTPKEGVFGFSLGAIAIAFIVYITAKGELPTYIGFFLFNAGTGTATASTSSSPASGTTATTTATQ